MWFLSPERSLTDTPIKEGNRNVRDGEDVEDENSDPGGKADFEQGEQHPLSLETTGGIHGG